MNVTKIWILQHPNEPTNVEIRTTKPYYEQEHIYSDEGETSEFVTWQEYVAIAIGEVDA